MEKTTLEPEGYCRNCGKNITRAEALSGTCSECGAAIVPMEVLLEDDVFMEGMF